MVPGVGQMMMARTNVKKVGPICSDPCRMSGSTEKRNLNEIILAILNPECIFQLIVYTA